MFLCKIDCALPDSGRNEFVVDLFTNDANLFNIVAADEICCCFLETSDYFIFLCTRHPETDIWKDPCSDIAFSEETAVVHSLTEEIEG